MSKAKAGSMNIFQIILNGFLLYIKNIVPLSKVMLFPVFGQLLGVLLILTPSYYFSKYITSIFPGESLVNNIGVIYFLLIASTLPGFFVFTKAFWEFMIAMPATSSMIGNYFKQGSVKDPKVHTQLIKARSKDYIVLLTILTLIWLIGLLAPLVLLVFRTMLDPIIFTAGFIGLELLVIFLITLASIYLSLSFQVFALENISPLNTIKKSWKLVEGNFWRTLFLGLLLTLITGTLVPELFKLLLERTSVISYLVKPIQEYTALIVGDSTAFSKTISSFNFNGTPVFASMMNPVYDISRMVFIMTLNSIIAGLMLPLGSAFYTLLYFDINSRKNSKSKKK